MPQNTVLNTNVTLEHSITRLASRISRPAFYARQESIVKGTAEQSQMVIVIQAFSAEVLQAMPDLEILEHYLQVQQPFVEHAISLMIVYAQHSIQQQGIFALLAIIVQGDRSSLPLAQEECIVHTLGSLPRKETVQQAITVMTALLYLPSTSATLVTIVHLVQKTRFPVKWARLQLDREIHRRVIVLSVQLAGIVIGVEWHQLQVLVLLDFSAPRDKQRALLQPTHALLVTIVQVETPFLVHAIMTRIKMQLDKVPAWPVLLVTFVTHQMDLS